MRQLTEGKADQFPRCLPGAKTVFYLDTAKSAYMKVSIDGGQPEPVAKLYGDFTSGYDVARDGKTVLLALTISKPRSRTFPWYRWIPARFSVLSSTIRGTADDLDLPRRESDRVSVP